MKYIVTINDKDYEVDVERGQAHVLSVTAAVQPSPTAAAPAEPAAAPVAAAPAAAVAPVAPAAQACGGEPLNAPMPGMILAVNKKAGDAVKSGEVVVLLEAMKMENEVVATRSGVITQVLVAKGSAVTTGQPLVMIA